MFLYLQWCSNEFTCFNAVTGSNQSDIFNVAVTFFAVISCPGSKKNGKNSIYHDHHVGVWIWLKHWRIIQGWNGNHLPRQKIQILHENFEAHKEQRQKEYLKTSISDWATKIPTLSPAMTIVVGQRTRPGVVLSRIGLNSPIKSKSNRAFANLHVQRDIIIDKNLTSWNLVICIVRMMQSGRI